MTLERPWLSRGWNWCKWQKVTGFGHMLPLNKKSRKNGPNKLAGRTQLQECIPVGCVPSAAVAVGGGGGVCYCGVGMSAWSRGPGVSAWSRRVSAWSRGCLLGWGDVCQMPPPPSTEWQTGVKTLPCSGKNVNKICTFEKMNPIHSDVHPCNDDGHF